MFWPVMNRASSERQMPMKLRVFIDAPLERAVRQPRGSVHDSQYIDIDWRY
jgi:hypothetical protein